jgi:hypothetical protein
MIARLKMRRDTNANWSASNPTLAQGEIGYTTDAPFILKIGDGTAAWNTLVSFAIPDGGTTGQVLAKNSATDQDVEWIDTAIPAQQTIFTTVATGTAWAKPAGCKTIRFQTMGSGGGGGAGARGLSTAVRYGGNGGGAGHYTDLLTEATDIPATVYATVGAAGTAGAAQTSDSTAGANGTAGNPCFVSTSSSGVLATAAESAIALGDGGHAGAGGLITTAPSAVTVLPGGMVPGGAGALSSQTTPNQPTQGGGGAGGGLTAANATAGLGSFGYAFAKGIYGRVGTGAPASGANGIAGSTSTTRITGVEAPGCGGSGGASHPGPGIGGTGGAGDRGGGGGGGGASSNTNNSGAGGAGGTGFVIITAYF